MKLLFKSIVSLLVLLLIAGCGGGGDSSQQKPVEYGAVLKGIVVDSRGGSAVAGADVITPFASAKTDAQGRFQLNFPDGNPYDIIIQKAGRAKTRVQGIKLKQNETLELEIPCRAQVDEGSNAPPQITVTGVTPGSTVSGMLDLNIKVTGEEAINLVYIYFSGEQREPATGISMEMDDLPLTINTTGYPDGPNYIKILAYDEKDNAALYYLPVIVQNGGDTGATVPPLTQLYLNSFSFGTSMNAYSLRPLEQLSKFQPKIAAKLQALQGGPTVEIQTAPTGGQIHIIISWEEVPGVDGYNVYRSFDGVNYQKIGSVLASQGEHYDDYSAQLAVGKKTYYKVAPYIDSQEGAALIREVTPLPTFNVYLQSPANNATGVSLNPTLSWQYQVSSPMPAGVEYSTTVAIYEEDIEVWSEKVEDDATQVTYSDSVLSSNTKYSWNVINSTATYTHSFDEEGYSIAFSFAGNGIGANNGPFFFTTGVE